MGVGEAAPRLHKAAHYARRALGDARSLVLGGESVALWPDVAVDIDAARFERLAESALAAGDAVAAGHAADTYTGDLLPDDPYESWTAAPRDRFRVLHARVLRLAERWDTLAVVEPGDEQAQLAVMRRLADSGDRAARCASSSGWNGSCAVNWGSPRARRRCDCATS